MRRFLTLALGAPLAAFAALAALGVARSAGAAACVEPGELEALPAERVPSLESFSLPNGLRVVMAPRGGERTVSVRVAYDVGARDELPDRGGVAHLFEHMMFKGSSQVPDGGHFRLVRDAGGPGACGRGSAAPPERRPGTAQRPSPPAELVEGAGIGPAVPRNASQRNQRSPTSRSAERGYRCTATRNRVEGRVYPAADLMRLPRRPRIRRAEPRSSDVEGSGTTVNESKNTLPSASVSSDTLPNVT